MTSRSRFGFSSRALSATLGLALASFGSPACKKSEDGEPVPDAVETPPAEPVPPEAKAAPPAEPVPLPALPQRTAPTVELGAIDYPAALASLLDLVPVDQQAFLVVRDPARALAAAMSLFGGRAEDVAKQLQRLGLDAERSAMVADVLVGISATLEGAPIQLDRGLVILPELGQGVVLFGSADAEALQGALAKIAGEGAKMRCRAVDAAEGFAACTRGEDRSLLEAVVPGKAADAKQKAVADGLVGLGLDRALVAGRLRLSEDALLSVAIEPFAGQAVVNLGLPPEQKLSEVLGPGAPRLLGLVAPGEGFAWARMSEGGLEIAKQRAPAMATGAITSLSGEVLTRPAVDPPGLLAALGVKDPAPIRSVIALAATQVGNIPPRLKDGTRLSAQARTVEVGSEKLQSIHVEISESKAFDVVAALGVSPHVDMFATEAFAGLLVGGAEDSIATLAKTPLDGPSQALVDALPPAAAVDLVEGRASTMVHVPVDGVSTDAFRSQVEGAITKLGGSADGGVGGAVMSLSGLLAALSSLTVWTRHDGDAVSIRLAIQPFAELATPEGEQASAAVGEFLAGKPASEVFGKLATSSTSPRARSYRIRAGREPAQAISSGVMVLVVAATVALSRLSPRMRPAKTGGKKVVVTPAPGGKRPQ